MSTRPAGPLYLCRNGHIVRQSWRAGLDCSKCKANERARAERTHERNIADAFTKLCAALARTTGGTA